MEAPGEVVDESRLRTPNLRKEYISIWIDNMATGIMELRGRHNKAAYAITQHGSYSDPLTNKKSKKIRAVWGDVNKKKYLYQMYTMGPDGKDYKSLEVTYQLMSKKVK